jgi:hypothetical protein
MWNKKKYSAKDNSIKGELHLTQNAIKKRVLQIGSQSGRVGSVLACCLDDLQFESWHGKSV